MTCDLAPLDGEPRTLDGWLTTFHLAVVILDPYTYESAWLLETAGRILDNFREADCRIAFVVTADADDAREFLGPWAQRILTFADPDRDLVKALGLERAAGVRPPPPGPRRSRPWPRAGTRPSGGTWPPSWARP